MMKGGDGYYYVKIDCENIFNKYTLFYSQIGKIMNEILNIIDKECINVYNKNAKRKSSDTRARMLFVD